MLAMQHFLVDGVRQALWSNRLTVLVATSIQEQQQEQVQSQQPLLQQQAADVVVPQRLRDMGVPVWVEGFQLCITSQSVVALMSADAFL